MKKNIFTAIIISVIVFLNSCASIDQPKAQNNFDHDLFFNHEHNSRNSLDWGGVYNGIIPAASSPGINFQITLNYDETYSVEYFYIDESGDIFIASGNFTWDARGSNIILDTEYLPHYYKVGENMLIQLDIEGNIITGELAENYVLRKIRD